MLFNSSYNNSIVKHIRTSHSISFMQTLLWINLPFVLSLPSHLEWWLLPVVLWLLLSVTVPPIRGRKYETKLQDVCLLFLYTGSKVHCTMTSFRCRTIVEFIIEKIILTFHQYQLRLMKLLSFAHLLCRRLHCIKVCILQTCMYTATSWFGKLPSHMYCVYVTCMQMSSHAHDVGPILKI